MEYLKNPTKKQLDNLEKYIGFTITNNGDLYVWGIDEERHKRFAKHFLPPNILKQSFMTGKASKEGNLFYAYRITDALRIVDRVRIGVIGSFKRAKKFFKKAEEISNQLSDKIKMDEYLSGQKSEFENIRRQSYKNIRQPVTVGGVKRKIKRLAKESGKLPIKRFKLR